MMERNFYSDDDFEQLIKEKTEQYKMYPSEKVWKGVHSSLHTKKKWFIGGMSLLITGIILFAGRELLLPERHPAKKPTLTAAIPATNKTATENTVMPAAFSEYKEGGTRASSNGARNNQLSSSRHFVQGAAYDPSSGLAGAESSGSADQANPSGVAPATIVTGASTTDAFTVAANPISIHPDNPLLNANAMNGREAGAAGTANTDPSVAVIASSANSTGASAAGTTLAGQPAGTGSRMNPAIASNTIASNKKAGRAARLSGLATTNADGASTITAGNVDGNLHTSGSTGNLSELTTDQQRINWLQDYAVYNLRPSPKRGRKALQLYFAPTVNYRSLSGGEYLTKAPQNVPYSLSHPGEAKDYVNHTPALGLEAGASILYRATRNLTFKAGLQFNYIRYTINAYSADSVQRATIGLGSNLNGYFPASITNYTTIRNLGGNKQQTLNNEYYQLSLPVGFEMRVLGNERLQLNIAATVQPTYLLNRNSYLLSTDYSNYTKEPSLFRRWNLNGAAEIFLSYKMGGGIRWQVGPEFRYQFLSSYTSDYSIREHLKAYGLRIGITKAIR